jgi:hypothetical protein
VLAPAILSFYRRRVVRLMDLSEFHAGRQGTANELARVIETLRAPSGGAVRSEE